MNEGITSRIMLNKNVNIAHYKKLDEIKFKKDYRFVKTGPVRACKSSLTPNQNYT